MASRPPPSLNQTRRFEEKREVILCAAATLFNDLGVKGATFADIAARVGLVPNSVTYYYRRKEDLAAACYLRATAVFARIAAEAAGAATARARVRDFIVRHARLLAAMDRGEHAPLILFNELHALPQPHLGQIYEAYTAMFRQVRGLIRGAGEVPFTRNESTARAHLLLSIVHWLRLWIWRNDPSQYERVAERLADIVLDGLPAAHASWRGSAAVDWALVDDAGGTVEAFLRAATALVNEQGYEGASVAKISARLNRTKGAFYHHHENKDDLIEACFERSFSVMRRALEIAEAGDGSGWERLRDMVFALIRFQLAPEGPMLRAAATSAMPDSAHRVMVRQTLDRLVERIAHGLVDGMLDASLQPLDPRIAAQLIVAGINGTAESRRWIPGLAPNEAARLYGEPLLGGLLHPPRPNSWF